jgi:hypothetical protein
MERIIYKRHSKILLLALPCLKNYRGGKKANKDGIRRYNCSNNELLKSTWFRACAIINFGKTSLEYKRLVY